MSKIRAFIYLGMILLSAFGAEAFADTEQSIGPLPAPLFIKPFSSWSENPATQLEITPSFEDQAMELVNQARWYNGQLPPLKRNDLLDNAAETHSSNMASRNFFAHCDLYSGAEPWERMSSASYNWNYAAENIACGYSTPEAVINALMHSAGHRANILSIVACELGIGYVCDAGDSATVRFDSDSDCNADTFDKGPFFHYWTQNFGRRSYVFPVVIDREACQTHSRNVQLYLYGRNWAVDMRLRNGNGLWTNWQAFSSDIAAWELAPGSGVKEVFAEIRNGAGTVLSMSDTIVLIDEEREVFFKKGFNLFSYPAEVPPEYSTCKKLLNSFVTPDEVESIARFNTTTQRFEFCDFECDNDFAIVAGEGYIVRMKKDKVVVFPGSSTSPMLNLTTGLNLVGPPAAPDDLTAFELLEELSDDVVTSIQRFNIATGAFETAGFDPDAQLVGVNFLIVPGEGFFIFMKQRVLDWRGNENKRK